MNTLVFDFFAVAPARVDLTMRTKRITTRTTTPVSLTMLDVRSGHKAH